MKTREIEIADRGRKGKRMDVFLIHMHTHTHTHFISCVVAYFVVTSVILGGINAIFKGEMLLLIHAFHKFVPCIVSGHCFKYMHACMRICLFHFFRVLHFFVLTTVKSLK